MKEDHAVVGEQINYLTIECLIDIVSVLMLKTANGVGVAKPGEFVLYLGELLAQVLNVQGSHAHDAFD